ELEQVALRLGDDDRRDLRPRERLLDALGARGADDDRRPLRVRLLQAGRVGDVVEDERTVQVQLALHRDLRNAAAGGPEPALPHTVMVSPGDISTTSTSVSCRSSSGVPARIGNVPQ